MLAAAAGASALFLCAACGSVPPKAFPPFEEFAVEADYAAPTGPVPLPASRADLVVHELHFTPATAREEFADGERRLVPPPGCDRLVVQCRYRAYAGSDGRIPAPANLFPGAQVHLLQP